MAGCHAAPPAATAAALWHRRQCRRPDRALPGTVGTAHRLGAGILAFRAPTTAVDRETSCGRCTNRSQSHGLEPPMTPGESGHGHPDKGKNGAGPDPFRPMDDGDDNAVWEMDDE